MKPEYKQEFEILMNEIRIVDASLAIEMNHERDLRIMYGHAYDRVKALRVAKDDLIERIEAITKETE
jgi:hypothetical protein